MSDPDLILLVRWMADEGYSAYEVADAVGEPHKYADELRQAHRVAAAAAAVPVATDVTGRPKGLTVNGPNGPEPVATEDGDEKRRLCVCHESGEAPCDDYADPGSDRCHHCQRYCVPVATDDEKPDDDVPIVRSAVRPTVYANGKPVPYSPVATDEPAETPRWTVGDHVQYRGKVGHVCEIGSEYATVRGENWFSALVPIERLEPVVKDKPASAPKREHVHATDGRICVCGLYPGEFAAGHARGAMDSFPLFDPRPSGAAQEGSQG